MSELGRIANMKMELAEAFAGHYKLVQIRVKHDTYYKIVDELGERKSVVVPDGLVKAQKIFSISLIVDSFIPDDIVFLIAEKRGKLK